tara:strand:+ start:1845 stop:2030 length:186 start_codon:yes stop_codon:yes gene_type:complete
MNIGGMMFAFGMVIVMIGVGMENIASSFLVSATGLFVMWVSAFIMMNEKSDWIDEDFHIKK